MKYVITALSLLGICLLTSCSIFKGGSDAKPGDIKKDKKVTSTEPISPELPLDQSLAAEEKIDNPSEIKKNQGRIIPGFLEPNVSELPNKNDLQESTNVAPLPKDVTPKDVTPKDIEPVSPVLEDPNTPLPDNL